MKRINWRITLERVEYDEEDKLVKKSDSRVLITDEMLHGSVIRAEAILEHHVTRIYHEIISEDA